MGRAKDKDRKDFFFLLANGFVPFYSSQSVGKGGNYCSILCNRCSAGSSHSSQGSQKSFGSKHPSDATAVPAKLQQPTGFQRLTSFNHPAPPALISADAAVCVSVS